ncbi:hypothetical protein CMV_025898 [Castanea mollissima]|uniref:Uncharacterized protein n=1 Tax=Castanea mollissima TaxID=60419 RepID=A0A8J4QJ06_9ROSI|nr:hypothetical protein CMV_025898 [Castanea mollissima]
MNSIRRAIVADSVAVVEAMKDLGICSCWTPEKTAQGPIIADCDAAVCSNHSNLSMVTRNHGGGNREMLRAEITTSNSENLVVEIEAMRWAMA